jgi:hypothetical protein
VLVWFFWFLENTTGPTISSYVARICDWTAIFLLDIDRGSFHVMRSVVQQGCISYMSDLWKWNPVIMVHFFRLYVVRRS